VMIVLCTQVESCLLNRLPHYVTGAPTLTTFRFRL